MVEENIEIYYNISAGLRGIMVFSRIALQKIRKGMGSQLQEAMP